MTPISYSDGPHRSHLSLALKTHIVAEGRSLTFVDSAMGTDNFRSEALEIIETMKHAALIARVNKCQWGRLADRYEAIGESLEDNLGPGVVGNEERVHDQSGNASNSAITPAITR